MKTAIVVAVLWLLGLSWAKIDQVKNYKKFFHPNYPAVRQRFARAQPAIYAPDKALSWVDNYYERSYAPQPYSFGYEVNDGYNNYGHQQESDGSVTTGSYRVLLPDGRTQIVNFRADKNGYVADVKYEVSLYKPSSSGSSSFHNKAPAAAPSPSYKVPAKSGSTKAWTAFTQFKPAAKRASYKSDLIAAFGSKIIQDGPGRPAGSFYKALDGNEIEDVQPTTPTTPTTPSHVIAEPIDAYENVPTTPVYYRDPTTEYQASTSTSTPSPITAERDDEIVDSGPWTAFKAADEDTSAPIYEARAVYRVIPETDYGTSDRRPASESYINDRAPIIPAAVSSSSQQDVRISPAYRDEVESTSTTPYQAAPSTQTYRVAPVPSSPDYQIATPEDGHSQGPSTPAYSVQPPVRPTETDIQPKIPEVPSYYEPERTTSTETYSPTDAVPAAAAPWSGFRQLPAANRIKPVPFYAREGYVAPTTYKPPIAFRFPASAENKARRLAAASSRRVSSAPAWTAWTSFRPTHDRSSATTPALSHSRFPSPLIFRQRKA